MIYERGDQGMKNRVSVLAIIIIFALACNACNRHEMMSNTGQQNSGMDQMMNNPVSKEGRKITL
jgi:hypothetical protein